MNVKRAVFEFFDQKGGIPGNTEDEKLNCEYLDLGIIDSMGIVEMITHFETLFQIRFLPSDMQSREFRTIGGLISVIERLWKGKQGNV